MSENSKLYLQAFEKVFGKPDNLVSFEFKVSPQWDSMAQIALVSTIEDFFDINFEMDDIFSFNSFMKGKEILTSKFGIEF